MFSETEAVLTGTHLCDSCLLSLTPALNNFCVPSRAWISHSMRLFGQHSVKVLAPSQAVSKCELMHHQTDVVSQSRSSVSSVDQFQTNQLQQVTGGASGSFRGSNFKDFQDSSHHPDCD